MEALFFWIFAIGLVGGAMAVILNRNPVACALSLALTFVFLAALFVTLEAFFLAMVQIIVYAGAVMVLFLFIIMLLDLKVEKRKRLNLPATCAGLLIALLVGAQVVTVVSKLEGGLAEKPALDFSEAREVRAAKLGDKASGDFILTKFQPGSETLPDTHLIGETIFTKFNLHLQVVGVLLLVATLGVVVLSKRKLR